MRIIFRADASKEIGTGHVMRLSALAEEAILRGHECIFLGQISDLEWVHRRITNLGFLQIISKQDEYVSNPREDVLIIDSYTLEPDTEYLSKFKWKAIVSIVDSHTPTYQCDLEVHPTLTGNVMGRYTDNVLSGPDFFLIRQEIKKRRDSISHSEVLRVLVLGGGSDINGFADSIVGILSKIDMPLEVHVFGEISKHKSNVIQIVTHEYGTQLDELSSSIDVVITTASTTSLEFIAREVPLGIVCAVENQNELYKELIQRKYAIGLGTLSTSNTLEFDLNNFYALLLNESLRREIICNVQGIVDLQGVKRIMDNIEIIGSRSN